MPLESVSSTSETSEHLGNAPVPLTRILVALDASDHANRALEEAARLAATADGTVTGIHAYAAKLHDNRFRQMEGGLPDRYRKEQEMEHQREVHDSLITRGLGIISDSYHDSAAPVCEEVGVAYRRLSPEGKNYRRLVEAAASGDHDVLMLGALGLGAVPGATVGTVCERVVRRSPIDALVIRDPGRALGDGPLVVALDGSQRSFGALKTAFDLGRRLGAPVHAVAAYDPYFHYVAFNKIAGVLSEEAGQTFRFKEQETLHEEIIDSGIAKIYQQHLEIGRALAEEEGIELVCELLDGKPYQAIARYLEKVGASLLLVGKTGVHADPELDIGGNAENLLRVAPCHIWLGQATYTPPLEAVARETITWTEEAEDKMARVPETGDHRRGDQTILPRARRQYGCRRASFVECGGGAAARDGRRSFGEHIDSAARGEAGQTRQFKRCAARARAAFPRGRGDAGAGLVGRGLGTVGAGAGHGAHGHSALRPGERPHRRHLGDHRRGDQTILPRARRQYGCRRASAAICAAPTATSMPARGAAAGRRSSTRARPANCWIRSQR
jgi:nucleotide-binding universal stress UspA family protein